MKYIDIRVIGNLTEVCEFLKVCGAIQWCGNVGAGRNIPVSVDGDGSGRLSFKILSDKGESSDVVSIPEEKWGNNFLSIGE